MKTPDEFRDALKKLMPGFAWTVHKPAFRGDTRLQATGIQSSGSNRTSTVMVILGEQYGKPAYTVKSSGYGRRDPWRGEATAPTLAQAFRELQSHYERLASMYHALGATLQNARKA